MSGGSGYGRYDVMMKPLEDTLANFSKVFSKKTEIFTIISFTGGESL